MFGGAFGHIRFGVRGKTELEVAVTALFIERVNSLVRAGGNIPIAHEMREHVSSAVILTRGIAVTHEFRENTGAQVTLSKDYPFAAEFRELVQSSAWLAGNIDVVHDFTETVKSRAFLSLNTPLRHDFLEHMSGSAFLGKNTPLSHEFRESVFGVTRAVTLEELSFYISANIKPGSELRVDSELFTAMLDGANIIHTHAGDWFTLDRNTVSLHINGNLTGTLVYLERYL